MSFVLFRRLGRGVSPFLTKLLMQRGLDSALKLLESYLAFIQGKGAGAGWALQAEVDIAVSQIRRPDAVIFDVGANMGEWSIRLSETLKGDRYRIFQFEPAQRCQDKLRALSLPRTKLICAAVGNKAGMATFFAPDDWSPIGSLHRRRDSYLQQYRFKEMAVPIVTIDEIIESHHIDVVDFMKLDIEGSELAALEGAREALETRRIKALTFEFGSGNINSRTYFHDFWDLLHSYRYAIFRICPGNVLLPIERYSEDLEYYRSVTNYLAIAGVS